jgi:hypothetical protein
MTDAPRLFRVVAALLFAVLGLGLVSWVLQTSADQRWPARNTGMPTAKLRELQAIAQEVDVLVIGTSRLLHGFDPTVLAAETRRLGRPLRACDLSLQRLLLWNRSACSAMHSRCRA